MKEMVLLGAQSVGVSSATRTHESVSAFWPYQPPNEEPRTRGPALTSTPVGKGED